MKNTQLRKLISLIILVLLLASLGVYSVLSAPGSPESITQPEELPQMLVIADPVEPLDPVYLPAPEETQLYAPQAATITVTYVGAWDPSAQAAFTYAKNLWQSQITSSVPIRIEARWQALGTGVLGGTSWAGAFVNFSGAPFTNTAYPNALANKLAGTDLNTSTGDIIVTMNSSFPSWYYGTSGVPPSGRYDFVSVVMHEITHGLGFAGSMRVGLTSCGSSSYGCWGLSGGSTLYPTVYDKYAVRGDNVSLLNTVTFPNPSTALRTVLTSGNVYFDGPQAKSANGGNKPKLFTPASWASGSSFSHLDEIYNGTSNAMMTYSLAPREVIHDPGAIARGMLRDIGWTTSVPTPTFTPRVFIRLPLVRR